MKATLSGRDEKTIMKIVVDCESDRVLGVHILGEDAGELAQVLGIAGQDGGNESRFRRDGRRAPDRRPKSWSPCAPASAATTR